MDAYLPVCDTVRPCIVAPASDQPWQPISGTQTLVWFTAPPPRNEVGPSSFENPVKTFVILNDPAVAGLERLRIFMGWKDNWDAEGGKAPRPAVIESATKIFALLAVHSFPSVTLTAGGDPMFVFDAPLNGEVVVTGVDTIDYFFANDAAPEGENVFLDQGVLPRDLIDYLHTA